MLDDSFAYLKCEVQSRMIGISLFELLDDPQRMQIVIEAPAVPLHQFIQFPFTGMTKRGCPMSCTSANASTSSEFNSSAVATVRAICDTSSVCVNRLRK